MDFRPFDGRLYIVTTGTPGGLYSVNTMTGAATAAYTLTGCDVLSANRYAVDFNPAADALRIISNTGVNYRVAMSDGTCFVDGAINAASGTTPSIFQVAYGSNFRGTDSTELLAIDATNLGNITVPNSGTYEFLFGLGQTITAPAGLDWVPATLTTPALFWASLNVGGVTGLYVVSITAAVVPVGTIGTGIPLRSIAISLTPFENSVFGLNLNGQLIRFETEDASSIVTADITGATGTFIGVDFRPADQLLYGVTTTGQVYTINLLTYVATQVGNTLNCTFPAPSSPLFYGFDWNPVANQLRVIDTNGNNWRIDVTNSLCLVDTSITDTTGGSTVPALTAIAYANNTVGQTVTSLLAFDVVGQSYGIVSPPNGGLYTPFGPLTDYALPTTNAASYDIFGNGNGLATFQIGTNSYVGSVNTGDGSFSFIAQAGNVVVRSLSVAFARVPMTPTSGFYPYAIALTSTAPQRVLNFSTTATGNSITSSVITNLTAGTTLLGMDLRPATNEIVAISSDNKIYIVDTRTAIAYFIANMTCQLSSSVTYAVNFNPVANLLRIVGSNGANYRLNVDNGTCITDGTLSYTAGASGTPSAVGVAYTNSVAGATATAEYILDQTLDSWARVTDPNGGATTNLGAVGASVDGASPVDIITTSGQQWAFAVIANTLYDVNIPTGNLRRYGGITSTTPIIGLTVFPAGWTPPSPPNITTTTTTTTSTSTSTGTGSTGTGTTGTGATGATTTGTGSSASSVLISFFVIACALAFAL